MKRPLRRAAGALAGVSMLLALSASAAGGAFDLTSPDLPAGQPIAPVHMANAFGCHGANESPQLNWSGAPAGTKSFAITMYDPFRPPVSGWWHWLVYDLPATTTSLARKAGDLGSALMPKGAKQGLPDGEAPERHYYGPCPDEGDPAHHYVITIYALSVEHLKVPDSSTAANIDYEVSRKALAKATIERPFERKKPQ